MKPNREIRKETRSLLSAGWFMRIFAAFAVLYAIIAVAGGVMEATYRDMGIQTWGDFMLAKAKAAMQDLHYAVPSMAAAAKMSGASLFNQFIAYLFSAIVMFGMACVAMKAARNEPGGWFKSAFGGFSRPFGVLWLLVRMNIQVILWMLFPFGIPGGCLVYYYGFSWLWTLPFLIPGIVAAYRYRLAWYMKSDNPDWSAGKCLAESGAKIRGFKWQAFRLDLFYIILMSIAFAIAVVPVVNIMKMNSSGTVVGIAMGLISVVVGAVAMIAVIWLMCGLIAARAVFYRELANG